MATLHRPRALVGALIVAMSGLAHADRTLTLDDALGLARAHSRELRAGREQVAAASAGVEQARAALLPTIAAQGRYTHNYKEVDFDAAALAAPTLGLAGAIRATTTNPLEAAAIAELERTTNAALASQPTIVIQKQEQLDGVVSASVPLVAPASYFGLTAAHRTFDAAQASSQARDAGVLVTVAQAYFAAAGTDELVVARKDAVTVATETFEVAKARVAAELANQVERTRAETALVRAQQDLAEAENARAAAYRALATLLGTHEPFTVRAEAAPAGDARATAAAPPPAPPVPGEVDALVAQARAKRPELVAQRASLAAAEATTRAEAWRWSPSLSAFGNVRLQNYAGFSGDRTAWAVGLQVDWLVFDGGLRDAHRHRASAQRREAELRLELLTDQLSDEVANALGALATKRKGVAAAERSVELARQTLQLIRAQYEAGAARQLDVLQAQDGLVGAEVGLAQAHFEAALADVQLRRATGAFPGA